MQKLSEFQNSFDEFAQAGRAEMHEICDTAA
jgi:hypothetical protein